MKCEKCRQKIEQERVEFLIENKRPMCCTECSAEQKVYIMSAYQGKHAPNLIIVPNLTDGSNDPGLIKQMQIRSIHNGWFLGKK